MMRRGRGRGPGFTRRSRRISGSGDSTGCHTGASGDRPRPWGFENSLRT
jgi:hypothetical protein